MPLPWDKMVEQLTFNGRRHSVLVGPHRNCVGFRQPGVAGRHVLHRSPSLVGGGRQRCSSPGRPDRRHSSTRATGRRPHVPHHCGQQRRSSDHDRRRFSSSIEDPSFERLSDRILCRDEEIEVRGPGLPCRIDAFDGKRWSIPGTVVADRFPKGATLGAFGGDSHPREVGSAESRIGRKTIAAQPASPRPVV